MSSATSSRYTTPAPTPTPTPPSTSLPAPKPTPKEPPFNVFSDDGTFLSRVVGNDNETSRKAKERKDKEKLLQQQMFAERWKRRGKRLLAADLSNTDVSEKLHKKSKHGPDHKDDTRGQVRRTVNDASK